eukprot:805811-Amphidinium_carterae.1
MLVHHLAHCTGDRLFVPWMLGCTFPRKRQICTRLWPVAAALLAILYRVYLRRHQWRSPLQTPRRLED